MYLNLTNYLDSLSQQILIDSDVGTISIHVLNTSLRYRRYLLFKAQETGIKSAISISPSAQLDLINSLNSVYRHHPE